jgi:hypothetical protein
MEYVTLGRTGLRVSVAGLGCGGFSQLGLAQGKTEDDAIAIIRQAADLVVNLFDSAAAYGTEAALGRAIKIGSPRGGRNHHEGAVQFQQPALNPGGDSCQPRQVTAAARYQLCRCIPAARCPTQCLRPCIERIGAGATAREEEGKASLSRHY